MPILGLQYDPYYYDQGGATFVSHVMVRNLKKHTNTVEFDKNTLQ